MQLACGLRISDLQQGNEGFVYSTFHRFFGWDHKVPPLWPEEMEYAVADFLKLDHDGMVERHPEDVFCYLTYRTGMCGGDEESVARGAELIRLARENSSDPLGEIIAAWRSQPSGIIQHLGLRMAMAREKVLQS